MSIGKDEKSSFKSRAYTANNNLELVHTNLCGPIDVQIYKEISISFYMLMTILGG